MKLTKDLREFVGDGGVTKVIWTIFTNPCFHSVVLYRLLSFFYRIKFHIFAKIIWYINRMLYSVDIDYRANLSGGFMLIHGLGTVIGKDVISKGSLCVYQGVTIGGSGKSKKTDDGKELWQPVIEEGVTIYSNAMVLGPIHISKDCVIKAGDRVTVDC